MNSAIGAASSPREQMRQRVHWLTARLHSFNKLCVRQRLYERPPFAEQDLTPERREPLELTELMDAQLPGPRLQEHPNLATGPRHPLAEVPKLSASLLSQFSPRFGAFSAVRCGLKGKPSIHTRVAPYLAFIQSQL